MRPAVPNLDKTDCKVLNCLFLHHVFSFWSWGYLYGKIKATGWDHSLGTKQEPGTPTPEHPIFRRISMREITTLLVFLEEGLQAPTSRAPSPPGSDSGTVALSTTPLCNFLTHVSENFIPDLCFVLNCSAQGKWRHSRLKDTKDLLTFPSASLYRTDSNALLSLSPG